MDLSAAATLVPSHSDSPALSFAGSLRSTGGSSFMAFAVPPMAPQTLSIHATTSASLPVVGDEDVEEPPLVHAVNASTQLVRTARAVRVMGRKLLRTASLSSSA